MDCSVLAGALGVFTQSEAEIEAQGAHVGNLTGLVIGGEGFCGNNGVNDS